jgi:hypothetical protein
MAVSHGMACEIRADGNDTNAAFFNPSASGLDRTQQATPHVIIDGTSITATVAATTSQLTLSGYSPDSSDIGNTIKITGGTMTVGIYEIIGVTGSNWIVDRSAGTAGQTGTGRMGGAIASLGQASADNISIGHKTGLVFWVKASAGVQQITSTAYSVSGGMFIQSGFSYGLRIEGYNTVRGDNGRFICRLATTGFSQNNAIFHVSSSGYGDMKNMDFDGNGESNVWVVRGGLSNSYLHGVSNASFGQAGGGIIANSVFYGPWARATNGATCYNCYFLDGATPLNSRLMNCVLTGTAGQWAVDGCHCINSVFSGFQYVARTSFAPTELVHCWIHNCTAWMSSASAGYHPFMADYCFRYGAMTDDANNTRNNNRAFNNLTEVSTDPFVNSVGNDFRLTSDAVSLYREAGLPSNERTVSNYAPWTDILPYSSDSTFHPLYATGRK